MTSDIYYAIGDVHGEAALLADLHARILKDARGKPAHIIHLGDLIDRGPDSRGVIDLVMALQSNPPAHVQVSALLGNHEAMLLDALDAGPAKLKLWLRNGGRETLQSYGLEEERIDADWPRVIPSAHIAWLRTLPMDLHDAERRILFVHAGIDPATFPACDRERRLWTRSPAFFNVDTWPNRPELDGLLVVHGHTPVSVPVPDISARRINLDTGACFGGPLSAVALRARKEPQILQAYRALRAAGAG